jgi:hypothetical protein
MGNCQYVVKISSEKMPASVRSPYKRIAVMCVKPGTFPSMISTRAKGVYLICREWRKLFVGKTAKCAYKIALTEATDLASNLNKMNMEEKHEY